MMIPFHRPRTRATRAGQLAVLLVCVLTLAACEQAEQLSGGIDLESAPPDVRAIHGTSAVEPTRDPSAAPSYADGVGRVTTDERDRIGTSEVPKPLNTIVSTSSVPDTLSATVVRPIERAQFLKDADRAFVSRAGCADASRLYAALAKPADLTGAVGSEWVTAQLRIAQCSMELREWTRSLEALANVKSARPREWSAPYFEGQTYCQMGQYERGTKTFRDLNGLMGTLATGARQAVSLLSKFGTATCDRLDYEASRQPERDKDQLDLFLGEYEEFIRGAEALQARTGLPAEYAKELSSALKSARDYSAKYVKPQ